MHYGYFRPAPTLKGGIFDRRVTTDHMQQLEDLKNATGLGTKVVVFLKFGTWVCWDKTRKGQGSHERSLLPSAGVTG